MARKKKFIRRWLTVRRLRWLLLRALVFIVPGAARRVGFVRASVDARTIVGRVLCDTQQVTRLAVTRLEQSEILLPASQNDTGKTEGNHAGRTNVIRFLAVFDNCEFHTHTQTLVHSTSFRSVRLDKEPPNWNQAKPGKLRKVTLGTGTHHFIENTNHYYHFFANSIIPLLRAYEDGYLSNAADSPLTFWLPRSAGEVQRIVLSAIARYIGGAKICDVTESEQLTGGQLLKLVELSDNYEWMPVDRPTVDTLMQVLAVSSNAQNLSRRLYLDRQGAKLRQITNDEAVKSALATLGYSPFIAHGGNFSGQVCRFDAATHVVAVHGAGLTNLLFCRPGTKVLEIFPSNFVKSTFFALSKQLNLDYHYLIAGPGDYNQAFSIDVETLAAKIKEMDEQDEKV